MVKLSTTLKDGLITHSQKWAEIEKSKFLLYNFCMESAVSYLQKGQKGDRRSLSSKEVTEFHHILNKLREGLCEGFLNLGSLFYSKEESEVKDLCSREVLKITGQLTEKNERINTIEMQFKQY